MKLGLYGATLKYTEHERAYANKTVADRTRASNLKRAKRIVLSVSDRAICNAVPIEPKGMEVRAELNVRFIAVF